MDLNLTDPYPVGEDYELLGMSAISMEILQQK